MCVIEIQVLKEVLDVGICKCKLSSRVGVNEANDYCDSLYESFNKSCQLTGSSELSLFRSGLGVWVPEFLLINLG